MTTFLDFWVHSCISWFLGKKFFVGKSNHYSRKSNEQTEVRTELFWFCLKQEATGRQRCLFYDRTDGDTTWTGSGEASGCEGWWGRVSSLSLSPTHSLSEKRSSDMDGRSWICCFFFFSFLLLALVHSYCIFLHISDKRGAFRTVLCEEREAEKKEKGKKPISY